MNTVFNFQSVNAVNTSWDNVKKIPNFETKITNMMFEKLQSNSNLITILPFAMKYSKGNKYDSNVFSNARKFIRILDLAIHMLGPDSELVEEYLFDLGSQHAVDYGLKQKHYPILGQILLETLETILGKDNFSSTTKDAWKSIYLFSTTCMARGATESLSRMNQT